MRVVCIFLSGSHNTSRIAEHFLRFSPQISVRQDAIFIEIGKSKNLYSEDTFYARVLVILRRLKLTAQISFGRDITDSFCFAKYKLNAINELPLISLVDFSDPFLRDEVVRKQVSRMVDTFKNLGIKKIKDFKLIPLSELISRYGIIGRHCYQRVHMTDFISWPNWIPEEKIIELKQLPYFDFYGELEPILFELKTQLDSIFLRLKAREKRLTGLKVIIKCEKTSVEPNPIKEFPFEFYSPQGETKGALRIIKERLNRHFDKNPIKSPIQELETHVLSMVSFTGAQKNIFNNNEEKQEKIFSLHNQLVEILGKNNVYQAQLTQDRRPEKSWTKVFESPHTLIENLDITKILPERATYLCKYPQKIEITSGYIYIKSKRYKILKWIDEVEKISGGWFENPEENIKNTFDRNYYHVEIEGHQKITVFELPNKQFYLHGYYG